MKNILLTFFSVIIIFVCGMITAALWLEAPEVGQVRFFMNHWYLFGIVALSAVCLFLGTMKPTAFLKSANDVRKALEEMEKPISLHNMQLEEIPTLFFHKLEN